MGYIKKKKTKVQMSGNDLCDFIPDDPSCATPEPEPTPDPVDPEPTDGGDLGGDEGEVEGGEEPMEEMEHMEHGKDHAKDHSDMTWDKFDEKASEYMDPMAGSLAYLGVAGGALMHAVTH